MTRKDLSSNARFVGRLGQAHLIVAAFVAAFVAAPSAAQVDCDPAGRNTPADPVPECVDSDGFAVSCGTPGRVRLWPPNDFRPASGFPRELPRHRDSTDRVAGKSVPGEGSGHELYSSVDIVTISGISRRLYVSYNAGIQVWDIENHPAFNGAPLDQVDGWPDQQGNSEWLKWPEPSEVLNYLEDVNAVNVSSTVDVVGAAGIKPAGVSFWKYNTSTKNFRQLYQDEGISARQVRLIKLNGGTIYAIVGSDQGLAVYNVTAALALDPAKCLDNQGTNPTCPGVFRGYVTQQSSRYVDALHIPANDRIYVSASNGLFSYLQIWEIANPQSPATSIERFSELLHTAGSALFQYNGHFYVAAINEGTGLNKERLRVLLVDTCIQGSNCSFATGTVKDAVTAISLDPAPGEGSDYSTANDFLTHSEFDGTPYLYYGLATGNLEGPDFDQLFDLSNLQPPNPLPLPGLPEITAGGGSYTDPCNGSKIRYWSHYYSSNAQGLNNMVPRVGKFSAGGYFYRAAATILDVHLLGDGGAPGASNIRTEVTNPQTEYWMSDVIAYEATASGDCSPSPLLWDWSASSSRADVAPAQISELTDTASYAFNCINALGRCPNALVSVEADNGDVSCSERSLTPATITVKDPDIAIVDAGTGATDTFEECQTVPFSANLAGRSPAWWEWRIDGEPLEGCDATYSATSDLAAAVVTCDVPAELISSDSIFRDGFESGNISAWTQVVNNSVVTSNAAVKAAGPMVAELHVWDTFNKALPAKAVNQIPFTIVESGVPAFSGAAQENVAGPSATLTHAATSATSWTWEIQDPAGEDTCTFPGVGTTSCYTETTATDTIFHAWLTAGTYEYRVTISNCGPDKASRTDQVTVEEGVEPNVLIFSPNTGGNACSGNVISGFTCNAGCEYDFTVRMAENAAYVFEFDWNRTSQTGANYSEQSAASNDASTLEWYFKHTFTATGSVYPIVRARNGGFTDEQGFFKVPITVVNGSCN